MKTFDFTIQYPNRPQQELKGITRDELSKLTTGYVILASVETRPQPEIERAVHYHDDIFKLLGNMLNPKIVAK